MKKYESVYYSGDDTLDHAIEVLKFIGEKHCHVEKTFGKQPVVVIHQDRSVRGTTIVVKPNTYIVKIPGFSDPTKINEFVDKFIDVDEDIYHTFVNGD